MVEDAFYISLLDLGMKIVHRGHDGTEKGSIE